MQEKAKYVYEKIQGNSQCSRDVGRNYSVRPKPGSSIQAISSYLWPKQCTASTFADWIIMRFDEIAPQKPLSPEQARLKSMKDRVKRDQEAIKAERARQRIKAGQEQLAQTNEMQP